jgi:hypothetical protein
MTEEWRDIPGYEGLYQVSDQGRIWSIRRQRALSPNVNNHYLRVQLSKDGSWKRFRVHKLVLLSFVGPRPDGYQVDHINRDRLDNRLSNLRYLHHSENEAQGAVTKNKLYIYRHNGEANPHSKLTNDQRIAIVALYATGRYTQQQIAAMYGICRQTVGELANGKSGAAITGVAGREALDAAEGR